VAHHRVCGGTQAVAAQQVRESRSGVHGQQRYRIVAVAASRGIGRSAPDTLYQNLSMRIRLREKANAFRRIRDRTLICMLSAPDQKVSKAPLMLRWSDQFHFRMGPIKLEGDLSSSREWSIGSVFGGLKFLRPTLRVANGDSFSLWP